EVSLCPSGSSLSSKPPKRRSAQRARPSLLLPEAAAPPLTVPCPYGRFGLAFRQHTAIWTDFDGPLTAGGAAIDVRGDARLTEGLHCRHVEYCTRGEAI